MATFVAEEERRTYIESDDLAAALRLLSDHGLTCEPHGAGAIVFGASPQQVGRLLFQTGPGVSHLRRLERSIEETYFDEIAERQRSDWSA